MAAGGGSTGFGAPGSCWSPAVGGTPEVSSTSCFRVPGATEAAGASATWRKSRCSTTTGELADLCMLLLPSAVPLDVAVAAVVVEAAGAAAGGAVALLPAELRDSAEGEARSNRRPPLAVGSPGTAWVAWAAAVGGIGEKAGEELEVAEAEDTADDADEGAAVGRKNVVVVAEGGGPSARELGRLALATKRRTRAGTACRRSPGASGCRLWMAGTVVDEDDDDEDAEEEAERTEALSGSACGRRRPEPANS